MGFETSALPQRDQVIQLHFDQSEVLLSLGTDQKVLSVPAAVTDWGGYALEPFVVSEMIDERARWVLNPFAFLRKALRLEEFPAADATTENGTRLLLSHIDADGFESRVERPGGPLAVTELRERILKRYRIPTTYSVITSTLGDGGQNQQQAPKLQAEAREVFKLPWIEAGSHTFSHPYYWQDSDSMRKEFKEKYLPIPGYTFSLTTEIPGSVRFMEQQLQIGRAHV